MGSLNITILPSVLLILFLKHTMDRGWTGKSGRVVTHCDVRLLHANAKEANRTLNFTTDFKEATVMKIYYRYLFSAYKKA